jgi:hypothetical protein
VFPISTSLIRIPPPSNDDTLIVFFTIDFDAFHTGSTTVSPSKSQALMEQSGVPFGAESSEATPPQDPLLRPLTATFGDHLDEHEEEWEYEYSTTETEVSILLQS